MYHKYKLNETCLRKKLVPKYTHIKIPTTNEEAKKAQAQTLCMKTEINFLYKMKEQLNMQLYTYTYTQCKHMAKAIDQY
jgi:hypothetical protein